MIWPVVLALETRAPQSASERARRKRYVARSGVRSLPVVRDVSNGCGWLAVRCGVAGGVASSRHSGDQDKISGHTASTPRISAIVEAGQHIEAGRAAARSQLHACAGPCARTVRCLCRCAGLWRHAAVDVDTPSRRDLLREYTSPAKLETVALVHECVSMQYAQRAGTRNPLALSEAQPGLAHSHGLTGVTAFHVDVCARVFRLMLPSCMTICERHGVYNYFSYPGAWCGRASIAVAVHGVHQPLCVRIRGVRPPESRAPVVARPANAGPCAMVGTPPV